VNKNDVAREGAETQCRPFNELITTRAAFGTLCVRAASFWSLTCDSSLAPVCMRQPNQICRAPSVNVGVRCALEWWVRTIAKIQLAYGAGTCDARTGQFCDAYVTVWLRHLTSERGSQTHHDIMDVNGAHPALGSVRCTPPRHRSRPEVDLSCTRQIYEVDKTGARYRLWLRNSRRIRGGMTRRGNGRYGVSGRTKSLRAQSPIQWNSPISAGC
jgi:hypothetical protein